MKAIRIHHFGGSKELKVEDVPEPKIKPGHAIVKIHDAGVNPVDWKIREGYLKDRARQSMPITMGLDFSGEIIRLSEVDTADGRFKVGDLVFGFAPGSYAELACVNLSNIAPMPESLDFATAASLPTAGLTAWQIINDVIHPSKGQTLLIHGAAGGVGSFAVQLARSQGAHVIATAAAEDQNYLEDLGVDKVIDYQAQRFEEHVNGVNAVIDLVGGETLRRSYDLVKNDGILVTTVGPLDQAECEKRNLRGIHFIMKPNPSELEELAQLVERKIITPRVSQILPLTEAQRAHEINQQGHSRGKIILEVIREQLEPHH
jgi:NADPH:quinone reductase-like Zn-dependent oxidoreductase